MNRLVRLSTFGLLTASILPSAQAQSPDEAPLFEPMASSDRLTWDSQHPDTGVADFRRAVACDVLGDGDADIAVLSNQGAYIWREFDHMTSLGVVAASDINDLDVVRRGSGLGDQIAVVGPDGLRYAEWANNSYQQLTIAYVATTNPTVWEDAKFVRCGDIDHDGSVDFVGIASDGSTLLRLMGGATATTEAVDLLKPINDMTLLQWDNDTALEVAVAFEVSGPSEYGLQIFDLSTGSLGALAVSFDLGVTCTHTARMKGLNRDRIVWSAADSGADSIRVIRYGLSLESVPLPSGMQVVGIACADADSDSDNDIMFNTLTDLRPRFLHNSFPATPSFTTPSSWTLATVDDDPMLATALSSDNHCLPVYQDFNGDGDADLFLALNHTDSSSASGATGIYMPCKRQLSSTVDWLEGGILTTAHNVSAPYERSIALSLKLNLLPENSSLGPANALEVAVFRQTSSEGDLEEDLIDWRMYDARPLLDPQSEASNMRVETEFLSNSDCLADATTGDPRLYWFELRPHVVDWTTNPPAILASFQRRYVGVGVTGSDVCDYLCDGQGDAAKHMDWVPSGESWSAEFCASSPVDAVDCWATSGSFGNAETNAAVRRVRLPPFPTNTFPIYPATWTEGLPLGPYFQNN